MHGGGVDRIWRDLIGGWILMLTGSGRILRSLMDGTGWIAMGVRSDIIDGGIAWIGGKMEAWSGGEGRI